MEDIAPEEQESFNRCWDEQILDMYMKVIDVADYIQITFKIFTPDSIPYLGKTNMSVGTIKMLANRIMKHVSKEPVKKAGRKPKYATEEERMEAKREACREFRRKQKAKLEELENIKSIVNKT